MDGLLVINKPQGLTSHDVVNKVRKIFKTKQVGHLGTLDPLATGVLVVCIGSATKLVQFLENVRKTYICEVMLGIETNSYDITGEVIEKKTINEINEEDVDMALKSFLGKSKQLPPLFSAIKKNGKKLYEYARNNVEVHVEARDIEIFEIERISEIVIKDGLAKFSFKAEVSKGTYIRSICHDLGTKLLVPATLSKLNRIKNGNFCLEKSFTLEQIEKGVYDLISSFEAISDMPCVDSEKLINKAMHGMKISFDDIRTNYQILPEKLAIVDGDKLIAIYLKDDELHCYKAGRVWL